MREIRMLRSTTSPGAPDLAASAPTGVGPTPALNSQNAHQQTRSMLYCLSTVTVTSSSCLWIVSAGAR